MNSVHRLSSFRILLPRAQALPAAGAARRVPRLPQGLRRAWLALVLSAGTSLSAAELHLQWNDNSSNEDGFQLERATGLDGDFAVVAKVGADTTSYRDTGLEAATPYRYRVRAFNAAGASAYSNITTSTTATSSVTANTPPLLGEIPAQSLRNGGMRSVKFTVSDATTDLAQLQLLATSSEPRLIPDSGLVLTGTGTQRTLKITSLKGHSGVATITLAVHDGAYVAYQRFEVTLTGAKPLPAPLLELHSRLSQLSLLGWAGPREILDVHFRTAGADKAMLVRAVGPTLATALSLPTVLADPRLTLNHDTGLLARNNNWGGSSALRTTFTRVGALPLPSSSKDAALIATVATGDAWISIDGAAGQTPGRVLAEVFDADAAPLSAARLTRFTSRTFIGAGDHEPILGFTVSGDEPRTLLLRTIADRSVSGTTVPRPRLELYRDGIRLQRLEGWSLTGDLLNATRQAGADDLTHLSDAAALLTLAPGAYTVVISSGEGASGIGSIELYEVR